MEESWVEEGDVDKIVSSYTVSKSENWAWHLRTLEVDQMSQVARMIVPTRLVAQKGFIKDARGILVGYISDPDRAYCNDWLLRPTGGKEVDEERFVKFLWKSVGMGSYYCDGVSRQRRRVGKWNVLFYGQC